MRPTAKTTNLHLEALRKALGWTQDSTTEAEKILLIETVERECGPEAIPVLLWSLYGGTNLQSKAAARAIDTIIRACDDIELARLDAAVRHVSSWWMEKLSPHDAIKIAQGLIGPLGIIASHYSGYVREAAVKALSDNSDGTELPFLLIRLNDWVEQVRLAAKTAIASRIGNDYIPHFVRHLPLVYRVGVQGRVVQTEIKHTILNLLSQPIAQPAVLAGLNDPHRNTRRLVFELLAGSQIRPEQLWHLAAQSPDPVIRLKGAQFAHTHLCDAKLRAALDRMSHDRFMPIRREAIYGYAEQFTAEAADVLHGALFDPHASVRDVARFFLRKMGDQDFAARYRAALESSDRFRLTTAIAGLGEAGVKADAQPLPKMLVHPYAQVRRAAVRALARLDPDRHTNDFLNALQDPSARVAKAAREVLRARFYEVPLSVLSSLLSHGVHPHTRVLAASIIREFAWWDAAPLLIAATGSDDQCLKSTATEYLHRFSGDNRRLTVRPTSKQLATLREALSRYRDYLPDQITGDIDFHLSCVDRELN